MGGIDPDASCVCVRWAFLGGGPRGAAMTALDTVTRVAVECLESGDRLTCFAKTHTLMALARFYKSEF